MFDLSKIIISAKARIKNLCLPNQPSEELAYFCGLMAGDGHVAIREDKNDCYLTIEGNPADERELYYQIICPLVKRLFNIDVQPQMFQHTFGIRIRSKALIQYLTDVLLLPKNRKYDQLRIPSWIKSDKKRVINYIRGLADTDFCLTLKKRHTSTPYYPVIVGCSESKKFINEIAEELQTFGLNVSKHYDYRYKDPRLKTGYYDHHRIYVYGHSELVKWMEIIGFYSPKHLSKFKSWQERNANSKRSKVKQALFASRNIRGALDSPSV